MTRRLTCFLLTAFLIGLAATAYSADNDYMRLARLSYIEGHVSLQYTSDVEWSAASINMPLEPGDRIYTGRDGRAEIEFDEGSVYRLAENTDIEVLSLNENFIQLRILVGLSSLTVSSGLDFEINTPAAAFITIRKGSYRFEVGENGETSAIVREGELEAANNEFVRRIHSGERLRIRLDGRTDLAQYYGRDSWDEWNDRRNADRWAYTSREYLPDTVYIGISDLDRHGRWVHVESYGTAWVPFSVGVSWSPYSVGRWCYRPFFGWTWVSYEPWGWLPYHYGRWYRSASFGWCWLPGPSFSFNFWSPGLVAFYNGPGWVSWCPLGPGDYYNINNYYYNRTVYRYQVDRLQALHTRVPGRPFHRNDRGAFRTVSHDHFRNGNPRGNGVATPRGYINAASREGTFVKDRLDIEPTRASYNANPGRSASRPNRAETLPAVVRNDPGIKTKSRGGYTQVTNPQVTSSSARVAQKRNEEKARIGGRETDPAVRVVPFGSSKDTGQSARSQSGSKSAEASGRRTAVQRSAPSSANSAGASVNSQSAARTARSQSNASSNAQSRSNSRYTYIGPEGRTESSSSQARQRIEQQRQTTTPNPSSSTSARRSSSSSSVTRAPSSSASRTYSAPRQSGSSVQQNRAAPSNSQARPRVQQRTQPSTSRSSSSVRRQSSSSSSTVRAPSTGRTRSYSAPAPRPSTQRNSAVRSSRAPSSSRSAQPSVRSNSGSSSSRSSGQAQRRSNSSSSGSARRR